MMSSVISVENLGKKYLLSHQSQQERYVALRDVLTEGVRKFCRRVTGGCDPGDDSRREEFWALRDVSFEVQQGERIGIIGRNGAGKSTLLKILSRITEPSTGTVRMRGKIASLLEVGTGFHPELTGRENIYLNGALLGMGRSEISRKFDSIVDFAEMEKFLDTPVKRYSSGMYVRLAFAVAAHLEPEILVVDEVLAVGDAQFQKKCLGKMEDLSSREGRTVLFVSHNMSAIELLCDKAVWLSGGKVARAGATAPVVTEYLRQTTQASRDRLASGAASNIKSVRAMAGDGYQTETFAAGEDIVFEIELYYPEMLHTPRVSVGVHTMSGERLVTIHTDIQNNSFWGFEGTRTIRAVWKGNRLTPSTYRVDVSFWGFDREIEALPGCLQLEIVPRDVYGTAALPDPSFQGHFLADAYWEL